MKFIDDRVKELYEKQPEPSENVDYVIVYMPYNKEKWCCLDRKSLLRTCDDCPYEHCVNFTHQVVNFVGEIEDAELQFPAMS